MSERCAEASEAAGESLGATAVSARAWLLVEVAGSWPRDVSSAGTLPAGAQQAIETWLGETPGSRLQFLRRPGRTGRRPLVFVARTEERLSQLRRFELDALDDLASVDLAEGGEQLDGSLVLVCGHGSRDRCCSLRGTAVFGALSGRLRDEELWISSHLGGHRFAANVAVLPAGLQFGRVTLDEAPYLVARALGGKIELGRYRGRTCYEPAVQAAERAIRAAAGLDGIDDLALTAQENGRIGFRTWDGGEWVAIADESRGPAVPASCGDEPAPQRSFAARVVQSPS